jgi:hypothetical protein
MALGLPVLASPLASYQEVIFSGCNGFICETLEDWGEGLHRLKNSEFRKMVWEHNQQDVLKYAPDRLYREWTKVLLNKPKP